MQCLVGVYPWLSHSHTHTHTHPKTPLFLGAFFFFFFFFSSCLPTIDEPTDSSVCSFFFVCCPLDVPTKTGIFWTSLVTSTYVHVRAWLVLCKGTKQSNVSFFSETSCIMQQSDSKKKLSLRKEFPRQTSCLVSLHCRPPAPAPSHTNSPSFWDYRIDSLGGGVTGYLSCPPPFFFFQSSFFFLVGERI